MKKVLEVREFETITCNKEWKDKSIYRYVDKKHFDELEHFIKNYTTEEEDSDSLEFMKIGYRRNVGDTITFNSNVGIIELPSGFQIEVLPKVSFDESDGDYSKTKKVFLMMLRCLKEFEGKSFNSASLNSDRMNLYEIFINMFIKETWNLVKHGLKSSYLAKEENLRFFKGKLQMANHIKLNAAHKEHFYMQYDEYQLNRPENRLVKATLLKLQKQTTSSANVKEIRQLLSSFEFVEPSVNYAKDFSKVTINRNTKDYALLMQWAKIFLLNKSFTTFSGEKTGKALLFPMEQIFEAFVAKWIRNIFEERGSHTMRVNVQTQDSGYYLFDQPRKFRLRPDIVVSYEKDGVPGTIILDTKWKQLKPDPRCNYGISQADMYQMYAYAKKYHTPDIWLLYPKNSDMKDMGDITFQAIQGEDQEVRVNVFFVDLEKYHESINELYKRCFI
ncbi:MAG: McrC family protein [Eubacteriales bacterium]|nr:McrC family protein [Eubacteriales bacterium]